MVRTSSRVVSVMLAAAALTGCAATPEASRSATSVQVPQSGSLTALSLAFQNQAPEVIYFAFDSDKLSAKARQDLDAQAAWILDNPNVKFRVYGHTDRVGSEDYNADLGLRRATRAVAYLVSKGISEERLEAMVSFGEDVPVVETEDREVLNRRVVTEVYGFVVPQTTAGTLDDDDIRNLVRVVIEDDFQEPGGDSDPTDGDDTSGSDDTGGDTDEGSGKNPNSGRGNGDEDGDPGKSGGKNNGGDEI